MKIPFLYTKNKIEKQKNNIPRNCLSSKTRKKKPYQTIGLIDITIVLIIRKKIFKVLIITNIKKFYH